MPQLLMFGRRWRASSDSLPIMAIVMFLVHTAFFVAATVIGTIISTFGREGGPEGGLEGGLQRQTDGQTDRKRPADSPTHRLADSPPYFFCTSIQAIRTIIAIKRKVFEHIFGARLP